MSKKAIKNLTKLDPLRGGDVILDKLGLPSLTGDKYGFMAEQDAVTGSTAADTTSTPTSVDPDVQAAREAQRKRQLAAAGLASTINTSPLGTTGSANTSMKTLLGS